MFRRSHVAVPFACLLATALAAVAPVFASGEPVILTVDGAITNEAAFDFTLSELDALPQVVVRTSTPWHKGTVEFSGVQLSHLMELVGAEGSTAYVVALNDYSSPVPLADFTDFGPILASRADGEVMSVSDKGPLFVIYPYDQNAELQTEQYYSRSVWQVRQITIE